MKKINIKSNVMQEEKKVKGFFNEFKTFIKRGNVIDLAVGVVIGSAFSKIVTSLVNDIIMPFIGLLLGGQDFVNLSIKINDTVIKYGSFIQNIVDFLIISFCIFIFVRIINNVFKKNEQDEKNVTQKKSEEIEILKEIRNILKKQK